LPQSNLSPAAKATARRKIVAACKKFGIEVSERTESTTQEDEVQKMSDEKKEAGPDITALVAELKAEFAKDNVPAALSEKLDQIEDQFRGIRLCYEFLILKVSSNALRRVRTRSFGVPGGRTNGQA
jgi:hypothetical protein